MNPNSLPKEYFDEIYARNADPWRFATSDYEQDKYRKTLDALPNSRYVSALEVGCSIGVLTQMLANRCERLLAIDIASSPLSDARRRCADAPWVQFSQMAAPAAWPDEKFHLIMLSEVVYYFSRRDVAYLAKRIEQSLRPSGDLVLVHWVGLTDYPLTGEEASDLFLTEVAYFARHVRHERFEHFRLDIARRFEAR